MANWRIYYSDGSTFDDSQGTPEDAPSFGVIAIPFPGPEVGRVIMNGWDWYYWRADHEQWWGSDIHGLLDSLLHNLPITAIKQGRNISNLEFAAVLERAISDPDFPRKSAKRRRESPN